MGAVDTDEVVYLSRLDLLERSLERVDRVNEDIAARFSGSVAPRVPNGSETPPRTLKDIINDFDGTIRGMWDLPDDVGVPPELIERLTVQMAELRRFERGSSRRISRVPEGVGIAIRNQAGRLRTQLALLRQSKNELPARWAKLLSISVEADELLGEYVDLIRGAALRNAEMDDCLCTLADELIRLVTAGSWTAMTVPARMEHTAAPAGHFIRFGLSGWSIFTLPVAVHQSGLLFVHDEKRLDVVLSDIEDARQRDVLLADVFSVVVLGPAYGWALLSARLDPSSESDRRRAAVVLGTLRLRIEADGSDIVRTNVGSFVDRLAEQWEQATRSCGTEPDDFVVPAEVEMEIRGRVPNPFLLDEWVSMVLPIAQGLASATGDIPALAGQPDARHTLNAAWRARIGTASVQVDLLERNTLAECERLRSATASISRLGNLSARPPTPEKVAPSA